ncbi:MAG: hypothetical protein IJ575_10855 [Selenomonadaceae bacterium]|nr:hypothetical protein [Selenomonadaceae bacterium]
MDYTAERLRDARQEFENVARRNEKDCKRIIEEFFDIYDSKFRDEPSVQGYNLDRLRRKKDSILWDIDGTLTSRVSSTISLNDSETRRILGIDDYSEMRRQLLRKMNDVQKDTLNSVAGTVREGLTSLSQDIERFMQDRVEETEQNIQNQREIFAKWESDLDQKNFDRDQAQLIPAEKLFAIQLIEEKLGT